MDIQRVVTMVTVISHTHSPFLVEVRVGEYLCGNTSAVDGWVRVQGPDKDLELRLDSFLLLFILTDEGQGTTPLTWRSQP